MPGRARTARSARARRTWARTAGTAARCTAPGRRPRVGWPLVGWHRTGWPQAGWHRVDRERRPGRGQQAGRGPRRRRVDEAEQEIAGARPLPRIFVQALQDDGPQGRRQAAHVRLLVHDPVHDGGHAVGAERQPAGGGVDHGQGPGEDVDGAGRPRARQLLGRHVGRGSDKPACDRGRVGEPGDAEVDDAGAVGAEQHVGRLEVAVHHARAVDRGQRGGRPRREALQVTLGQRPLAVHALLERRAVDELADDEAPVAFRRRLDDTGRDERLDLVNGVELAGQPLEDVGVDGRPQHLDSDPLFPRVRAAAEVHDTLAALAEPSEELETAQSQRIARLQRFGRHCFLRDHSAGTTTLP